MSGWSSSRSVRVTASNTVHNKSGPKPGHTQSRGFSGVFSLSLHPAQEQTVSSNLGGEFPPPPPPPPPPERAPLAVHYEYCTSLHRTVPSAHLLPVLPKAWAHGGAVLESVRFLDPDEPERDPCSAAIELARVLPAVPIRGFPIPGLSSRPSIDIP
jgi:hypothetical protein